MGDCEQMETYSGIVYWAADVSTQIRLFEKKKKKLIWKWEEKAQRQAEMLLYLWLFF